MVEVRVVGGGLRKRLGGKRLEAEAGSVAELLDALGLEPNRDLQVLVNGQATVHLQGLDTAIEADDSVTLLFTGVRGFPGG